MDSLRGDCLTAPLAPLSLEALCSIVDCGQRTRWLTLLMGTKAEQRQPHEAERFRNNAFNEDGMAGGKPVPFYLTATAADERSAGHRLNACLSGLSHIYLHAVN